MKHVLIVDDEQSFLLSLSEGLAPLQSEFTVHLARNGLEAVAVLYQNKIDLVVTDLKMPEMDGFDLLAHLVGEYPRIPAIVMTAFGTFEIEEQIRDIGTFPYLEKPIELHVLADRILNELDAQNKGKISGVSLPSFLQLIEMEQKTFTLRVSSERRVAYLYFLEGSLIDAETSTLRGEEAIFEILQWVEPEIQINRFCRRGTKVIQNSLSNILLEAMRMLDELNYGLEPNPPAKAELPASLSSSHPAPVFDPLMARSDLPVGSNLDALYQHDRELPILFTSDPGYPNRVLKSDEDLPSVTQTLGELMGIEGALAVALCDWNARICLGTSGIDSPIFPLSKIEFAIAGNIELVKAKQLTIQYLAINDGLEDILYTLKNQYHVVRLVKRYPQLFLYLVLNRKKSNLAMARLILSRIEEKLVLE